MSDWTFIRETKPRARKDHQCTLCGFKICKGEVYVSRSGVCDGCLGSSQMHVICEQVSRSWSEDGWEHQDVHEFRRELAEYIKRNLPQQQNGKV
jgi:Fe-S cluster biogenesis protein NfuA